MKKLFAVLLIVTLLVSLLASCQRTGEYEPTATQDKIPPTTAATTETETEPTGETDTGEPEDRFVAGRWTLDISDVKLDALMATLGGAEGLDIAALSESLDLSEVAQGLYEIFTLEFTEGHKVILSFSTFELLGAYQGMMSAVYDALAMLSLEDFGKVCGYSEAQLKEVENALKQNKMTWPEYVALLKDLMIQELDPSSLDEEALTALIESFATGEYTREEDMVISEVATWVLGDGTVLMKAGSGASVLEIINDSTLQLQKARREGDFLVEGIKLLKE